MKIFLKKLTLGAALLGASLMISEVNAAEVRNVVLVHGAFADGSGWKGVSDRLIAKGYKVAVVQEPLTSLEDDVRVTRQVIDSFDGPVVLVGHSYGGNIITEAGADPKVASLVYVAANLPDVGESLADLFDRVPSPSASVIKSTPDGRLFLDPAQFRTAFAADLPKNQTDFMAISQVAINGKILGTKASVAAWKDKPTYAILSGADKANDPKLQKFMYERAKAKVTEIKGASHAVYISNPDKVAAVIEDAANH